MNAMAWLALQVQDCVARECVRSKPPNPRPLGRFSEAGAAAAVLDWLLQRKSAVSWWSMHQLIAGTGRSAKACSWAVIYLWRHGYIERERDVANTRYLRYRASAKAHTEGMK